MSHNQYYGSALGTNGQPSTTSAYAPPTTASSATGGNTNYLATLYQTLQQLPVSTQQTPATGYYGYAQQATAQNPSQFMLTNATATAMQQALQSLNPLGLGGQTGASQQGYMMANSYLAPPPGLSMQQQGRPHQMQSRNVTNAVPTNALWIGDLEPWMDEQYLYAVFSNTQDLVNVKVIKDKQTKEPSGYGFIYYANAVASQTVLQAFSGQIMPNTTNKMFKLNYATQGGAKGQHAQEHRQPHQPSYQQPYQQQQPQQQQQKQADAGGLFIGDLAPDVTEQTLTATFRHFYPSVHTARVVMDHQTGHSKGYGFVYFSDEMEKQRALTEMQGYYISTRPIKINLASKKGGQSDHQQQQTHYQQPQQRMPQSRQQGQPRGGGPRRDARPSNNFSGELDPNNRTVFIGGTADQVNYEVIKSVFSTYGTIGNIKIPPGKGCAFVEFGTHEEAVEALRSLGNQVVLSGQTVRLGWGKPSASSQPSVPEKRKLDAVEQYSPEPAYQEHEDDQGLQSHDNSSFVHEQSHDGQEQNQHESNIPQPNEEEYNPAQVDFKEEYQPTSTDDVPKGEESEDLAAKKRKV